MKKSFREKLINKEFAVTMEIEIPKGVHIFPMGYIDLVRNLFEEGAAYNE